MAGNDELQPPFRVTQNGDVDHQWLIFDKNDFCLVVDGNVVVIEDDPARMNKNDRAELRSTATALIGANTDYVVRVWATDADDLVSHTERRSDRITVHLVDGTERTKHPGHLSETRALVALLTDPNGILTLDSGDSVSGYIEYIPVRNVLTMEVHTAIENHR